MGFYLRLILVSFFLGSSLIAIEDSNPSKYQVLYLMQAGEVERAIELYQEEVKKNKKHDFSILEQISYILLSQGAKSGDEESQLLSMYGAGMAGTLESVEIYEYGMASRNPMVQMATIHFLSGILDDRAEELLLSAFSSPYLVIRLEAAHALALRKSQHITGMIDSLMQRIPPYLHIHFPELFAMIGSADAMGILQKLMNDRYLHVRLAAILSAAKFGRDDFLNTIRANITHPDQAEQETCAAALGFLQDSHSTETLKELANSPSTNVKLAACRSLMQLGHHDFKDFIIHAAKEKNPLAIMLLSDIPETEPLLGALTKDDNFHIRVNAALALLKKRDERAIPTLMKMLIQDEKDWGYQPMFSLGHSLMAWKVIPSSTQYAKKMKQDIPSISLALKEQILLDALEISETAFLSMAKILFETKQNTLIPLLIHLLENLKTPNTIEFLKEQSRRAGAPFIRTYCHLALYRLGVEGPHRERLFCWISKQKEEQMIRFRPMLPWIERQGENAFQLTPEETSRLLIEAFITLAEQHDLEGIDVLLDAIQNGYKKNRYALAGLLLKSIQ